MQNQILNFLSLLKGFCFSICLFVCPLLFLTDVTQNPFTVQPLFFSIFGGLFILCCALEILLKKELSFRYSKIDFALFAFLFFLLCSLIFNYIFGAYKTALINEFLRKADFIFFGLIFGFLFAKILTVKYDFSTSSYNFLKNVFIWCSLWLLYKLQASSSIVILLFSIGIYFCYLHLKNYGIKEVFDVLLAVCFCACLYGLMQALGFELFWVLDVSKEFGARPVSTFGNPNFLASFTLLFLPYSLVLFVKSKSKKEILISGFVTLVLVLFLFISGTRSAWVGLIGASFLFVILSNCRKVLFKNFLKLFILFLVFCACAFGLNAGLKYNNASAPKARISEVKQVLNLKDISLQNKTFIQPLHQRLMMWNCAFDGFKKSPVFGNGVNSFQLNFPFCQGKLIAQNPALDKIKMQANAVHNEYLEILYEGGLFAFITYLILWVLFFTLIIKKIKTLDDDNKVFYLALLFGLTSVLIDNLFNITLRTLLTSFAFWFTFSAVNNLVSQNKKIKLKNIFDVIFVITFALIFVLIWFETKQFVSQRYELKGYKYLVTKDNKGTVNNMERAIDFSSLRPEPFYTLLTTYIDLGDLDKAEDITKKVLKLYPAYYEFYFRLAALQNAQNNNLEALQNLRINLRLLPTYIPAAELFANILVHQESVTNEDKNLLEQLIEVLPYNTNLPSYLSEIYFKENNCINARTFALKALEKNIFDKVSFKILQACHSNQEALLHYAEVLINLKEQVKKQDSKVLAKLEQMLKETPNDQDLQMLLAEVYFRKGNFCQAENILKQIGEGGKAYNFALSLAAQKCGDLLTSQKALTNILSLDPYDELAKSRLKNVKI